jgi:hypothetical protein
MINETKNDLGAFLDFVRSRLQVGAAPPNLVKWVLFE